jgi:hypothetical protein
MNEDDVSLFSSARKSKAAVNVEGTRILALRLTWNEADGMG